MKRIIANILKFGVDQIERLDMHKTTLNKVLDNPENYTLCFNGVKHINHKSNKKCSSYLCGCVGLGDMTQATTKQIRRAVRNKIKDLTVIRSEKDSLSLEIYV